MASLGLNRVPRASFTAADPEGQVGLAAIHRAAGRIIAADDHDEVLGHAADWAMAHFRPTFGVVAVVERPDGAAVVQAAHGTGASQLIGVVMPELFDGAADEVVFDPDLCGSPNASDRARAAQFGTRSCAAVPIVVAGSVVGSLSVVLTQPQVPWQPDLIALSLMAQLVSVKLSASPTWIRAKLPVKQQRFQSLLAWIDGNLERPMTQADVAARMQLSPAGCARAFREAFGISLHQYVIGQRIGRARKLLATGRVTVNEVAEAVGFPSESWFSQSFRRRVGVTPSVYLRSPERYEPECARLSTVGLVRLREHAVRDHHGSRLHGGAARQ